jgi:hypothetical protein
MFVMLVNVQKAISYLIRVHLVLQKLLQSFFLDVWGPALKFVGQNKYYLSFIDDFSKFVWIYPLKINLKSSKNFMNSKHLLSAN